MAIPIRFEHSDKNNENVLVINWCLGSVCNYRCSYCPDNLHDSSVKWPTLKVITNFLDKLFKAYPDKQIYIELTGGEVSCHKDLIKILNYILMRNKTSVGLLSNGSPSEKWWVNVSQKIEHLCLSYHPEHANDKHFFNIVSLMYRSIPIHINVMMHPDYFDHCRYFAKSLSEAFHGVSVAMQPLFKDMITSISYDYTLEQKKILEKPDFYIWPTTFEPISKQIYRGEMKIIFDDEKAERTSSNAMITKGINSWRGWSCNAGLENLVIYTDGKIFRGWCGVGGEVGSIFDDKIHFPGTPIICTVDKCYCGFDIMCTKFK